MRGLPFFKAKNKPQFAGLNFSDTSSGGGGGSIDTSALANKTDLTAIILTGTTNTSGDVISAGTWFYLNGTPCVAKVDIASGATFTEGTNYEEKTIGSALSELNSKYLQYHKDYYQQPSARDIIEDIVNTLLPMGATASKSFMWSGLNNNVAYYECVGQCGLNAVSGLYFDQAQAVFFYYYNSTQVVYHTITFSS